MSSGHNNTFFSNDGAGKEAERTDSALLTLAGIRALFDDC
jgi:hypothetical protein